MFTKPIAVNPMVMLIGDNYLHIKYPDPRLMDFTSLEQDFKLLTADERRLLMDRMQEFQMYFAEMRRVAIGWDRDLAACATEPKTAVATA